MKVCFTAGRRKEVKWWGIHHADEYQSAVGLEPTTT